LPKLQYAQLLVLLAGVILLLEEPAVVAAEDGVAPKSALLVDGVAAHVGDKTITVGEVVGIVQPTVRRLSATCTGSELKERIAQSYRDGVGLAIDRQLILSAYEKRENKIPEWVFRNRADAIVAQSFDGDRDALMKALAKDGLDYERWLQAIREQVIVSTMRREFVDRRVRVSPAAVRDAYNTNRAQYAVAEQVQVRLLSIGKGSNDADVRVRLDRIEAIRKEAVAGKDFASLAQTHSEHRTKEEGGSLGWIEPRKALRRELAEAIGTIRTGEISPVIEVAGDYYILKVEGRRDGGVQSFESVQAEIEHDLRLRETDAVYKAWTAQLRRGVHISKADVDPFR
jgi:parvulin-like peptidyl-prolyl isomerase